MQFFRLFLVSFFLIFSFTFTACQGNNSDIPVDDTNETIPIDINATTDVTNLSIVNGNVISVTGSGSTRDIYIMTFNSSGSTNTAGAVTFQYPAAFINDGIFYGSIDPGTATISDGRVHFVYTAPDDISDINGTRAEFLFYDTNNANASVSLYIDFNLTGDYVATAPVLKTLTLSDSNLTINSSSQVENLTLQAYTDQSTTNIDVSLDIKYPQDIIDNNINIGILPATLEVRNGIVTFNYEGVSDIEATVNALNANSISNPIKVNIYDAQTGSNVDLNLNFVLPPVVDPKYANYVLNVFPENNVSIIDNEQEAVLEVYLEDNSTGLPVVSESVLIDFFDSSEGTLNSFSGSTDSNGHIAFNYKAPTDITALSDLNITFKLRDNTETTNFTTILFDSNAPKKDYTDYKLSLVDVNRTIMSVSQVEKFSLYLEDNSTGTAKAAEGDEIVVDFFDGSAGTLNSFSAVTDSNGHVEFTYTAPENLTDFNGTVITFRVKNTNDIANSVASTFTVSTNDALLSKVQLAKSEITLSKNGEVATIDVLAFNGNGEAYSGGSIIVRYPSEITNDGNISGGQFVQSSVDIVDGKASFNFIGPDPLVSIPALNFVFVYSEDSDINTTLSVNYIPDVPTIVFDDNNITVTKNGEVIAISMTVYDKDNAYYPDGSISIKYPDSVLTGKDVGSFDTSSVPLVNGKVTFTYTAANPLDGNDSIIFTFYHDAQPILSEKDLNITIVPDSGQIVLTNYTLDAIYNTSMDLNVTKQMTFFVADDQGTNLADSNISSMTVTILNSALGSLEDSSGNTGSSLSVDYKNSVQMNVRSTTLSGVLPIQVDTTFKDANNNEQNLTRVFNIVVLSGPPTAMSLSYAGTSQNSETAKFIENWVLTVTDKYNNLVNSTPAISMGMITGYTNSSATTSNIANYLYYNATANDGNLTDGTTDTFTSTRDAFDNVDLTNDKLVLFGGDGYRFSAFGKWDIDSFTSNELTLKDDYNGSDVTGLTYAIGHNFRNEWCSGDPVVANVYAKDNNNILDQTGSMIIQVEYDYYLVGKSVVLWTNLVGESNDTIAKIGLAKKVTLRGSGLTGATYDYAKGFEGIVRLNVTISNTVEYYQNANFGYAVVVTGDDTNWTISGNSMIDGNITDCSLNGGVGYVDVNVTDPAGSAGTIKLVNVLPSDEF